ncbi:MAG: hypothetical protein IPG18_11465 [Saprospiraceae bacterium]|nr:hypothetical protein [Saprospiraceae bacterium]
MGAPLSGTTTITNNLIGEQGTTLSGAPPFISPSTTVYTKGIWVAGTTSLTITGNTLKNILSYIGTQMNAIELNTAIGGTGGIININSNIVNGLVNNSTTSTSSIQGIIVSSASTGSVVSVSSNTVSFVQTSAGTSFTPKPTGITYSGTVGATLEKNRVSTIYNRMTGTGGVYGINYTSGNTATIQNNFVWDINQNMSGGGAFSTTFGIFGIRIAGGTGHKIYHNNVHLEGLMFGTATSSLLTAALTITATSLTGLDVRNNIFSNVMTGGTTSIAHVSTNLPSSGTSSMNLIWNNNAYYSGSTAGVHGICHAGTVYQAL